MTDAVTKQANNANIRSGARPNRVDFGKRTTHPSYTEYSWSSLTGRNQSIADRRGQASQNTARKGAQRSAYQTATRAAAPGANVRRTTTAAPTANIPRAAAPGANVRRTTTAVPGANMPRTAASGANVRRMTAAGARPVGLDPTAQKHKARSGAKSVGIEKVKQKAEKIRKKSITTLHTIVIQKSYAFPLSIVLIAVTVTALILAVITASVRINEITTENSELSNKYASLLSEENDLRTELETRDDLRVVEEMAKDELGMVKKDQVQKYYLTINKQDKIELVDEEVSEKQSFIDELLAFGASIADRIRAFFGL